MHNTLTAVKSKIQKLNNSGFLHIMLGNTLLKFISMLSAIFIARILTKSEMGVLSYIDNIYSYALAIAGFGAAGGILRYCTISKQKDEEIAYFKFGLKFGTLFQFLVVGIIIFISLLFSFPFAGTKELMIAFSVFPMLNFLYEYFATFMRVEFKFKKYSLIVIIYSLTLITSIILLAKLYKLYGVIISRYISIIIGLILSAVIVIKIIKDKNINLYEKQCLNYKQKKDFLSYCFASICATSFSLIIPLNDTFLVNNIIKNDIVSANYKVAVTIPQALTFITSSVMMFAIPYFAKNENNRVWLLKSSKLLQSSLAIFYIFLILIYCFFSKNIIQIIFGSKYVEISLLSSMLFIVYCINAGFRMIALNILLALGYAKFNAYMALFSVIFQFIIDYILISSIGVNGAVYGIFLVYSITGIVAWIFLLAKIKSRRKINYD